VQQQDSPERQHLPAVWVRASVVGSLWASVEILLGSFLHNLRLPFAGLLLSAIGVLVMVSFHQVWPFRGLLWRAGVICAAMKSLSPSAIILGPMLGIVMEALLLEGATRISGNTKAGYLLGGALAVAWSLAQKIISTVILFGTDIVELYVRIYQFSAATLRFDHAGPIDLILILFGLNMIAGSGFARLGIMIGNASSGSFPADVLPEPGRDGINGLVHDPEQRFSPSLLIVHLIAVSCGLFVIRLFPLWIATAYAVLYYSLAIARYRTPLLRVLHPKLWIELGAVALLASFFLGTVQGGFLWNWNGLGAGVEMCNRAVVMVLGFGAIGVELRNPAIVSWFMGKGMGHYVGALTFAFETLPVMTQLVANRRSRWAAHPVQNTGKVVRDLTIWLEDQQQSCDGQAVVIVTGRKGDGKTDVVGNVVGILRTEGIRTGGIMAPGLWRNGRRQGFDVVDLSSGEKMELCRIDGREDWQRAGPFRFRPEAVRFGRNALSEALMRNDNLIVVDEVGPLELEGRGWAPELDRLAGAGTNAMLWTVREHLVTDVCARWNLREIHIVSARSGNPEEIASRIVEFLRRRSAETQR
jgi:nucleoside-triphosphatase THEP1